MISFAGTHEQWTAYEWGASKPELEMQGYYFTVEGKTYKPYVQCAQCHEPTPYPYFWKHADGDTFSITATHHGRLLYGMVNTEVLTAALGTEAIMELGEFKEEGL